MKKTMLWGIAFSMIFLVITMPFYISDVFAQQDVSLIDSYTISGENGAFGYVMSTDTLNILVNLRAAQLNATDVAQHVFIDFGAEKEAFDRCEPLENSFYSCIFQQDFENMPGGPVSGGKIRLDAPNCISSCNLNFAITVDATPPKFSAFTLSPSKTNGGNVTASYTAKDQVCANCGSLCSGIKRVVVYPSNDYSNHLADVEINQSPSSNCQDDVRTLNIKTSSLPSGNYSVCIAGSDNVGNINMTPVKCSKLIVAKEPPTIQNPQINDEYGIPITYVSSLGKQAILEFQLVSPYADIPQNNVKADLNAFQQGNDVTVACVKQSGNRTWDCKAFFWAIVSEDSATQTVNIRVLDDVGNVASTDFVFGLKADSNPPELRSFYTNHRTASRSFFGPENNVMTVELLEPQSGFNRNSTYAKRLEEYFDISVGGPDAKYQGKCSLISGTWVCSWPALDLQTLAEKASIPFEVYDDTGNKFEFVEEVLIDNQPPVVVDVEMHTDNPYPAIGAGENVVVRANITDLSGIVNYNGDYNVYLDLTMIEGGEVMRKADSCELANETFNQGIIYTGSRWICSWIVQQVQENSYWVPIINITDVAGNAQEYFEYPKYVVYPNPQTGESYFELQDHFRVLPTEEEVGDYWRVTMGAPSPASLDKQILQVIDQIAYVPLEFSPVSGGGPEILQVTLESCDNDGTAEAINLFPNVPEASNIELKIRSGSYGDKKYLRYLCQVGIVSIVDDRITQKEINNVTVGVGLYDMPLGTFDKNVRDKVKDIYEEVFTSLYDLTAFLNQMFQWLQTICRLYNLIAGILALFNSNIIATEPALAACESSIFALPLCASVGEATTAAAKALEESNLGVDKFMRPMCMVANCKMEGLYGGKLVPFWTKYSEFNEQTNSKIAGWLGRNIVNPSGKEQSAKGAKISMGVEAVSANIVKIFPTDPTQNMPLSIISACLPGIVSNLEKYRQVQCNYGLCVLQMAAGHGGNEGPIKGCEEVHKVELCMAVTGQIFQFIPFYTTVKNLEGYISTIFHDPFSSAYFVGGIACLALPSGVSILRSESAACRAYNAVANVLDWFTYLMDQYQFIAGLVAQSQSEEGFAQQDRCQAFKDAYDDLRA